MTTLLSPFDLSDAETQTGRTFRKQILKKGTINYRGQKISFDDAFCREAVRAFRSGAYDQVPFVLADMSNRHNMDPERFRGEIVDLEETADGIDAIVKTTRAGSKAIESNPKLGVSARIVQGLEKVDGRRFKVAIQHVLATMDPRLTGMRPWEAVDLSEVDEDEEVLDLTTVHVKRGKPVGKQTATKQRSVGRGEVLNIDLSRLTDEQFDIILSAAVVEDDTDVEDDADDVIEETVTRKTKKAAAKRRQVVAEEDPEEDDEDEEDLEESDDEEEVVEDDDLEDEDEEEEVVPVKSKKRKIEPPRQRKRVEMSTPVKRRKTTKARRLEIELAEERWANRKTELIDAGVPPALINLAEPVMKQPDRLVIDLSETGDRTVDAKAILGRVLEEVKGMIDLSVELGHGVSQVERDEKGNHTSLGLKAWDEEYGKP